MIKRFFATLFAITMLATLSACENKGNPSATTTTTTNVETTTTNVETTTVSTESSSTADTSSGETTTAATTTETAATTTTTVATTTETATTTTTTATTTTTTSTVTTTVPTTSTTSFQSVVYPLPLVEADWEYAKLGEFNGQTELQLWYLFFKTESYEFIAGGPALNQMSQAELDAAVSENPYNFIKHDGVYYSPGRGDGDAFTSYTEEHNVITVHVGSGEIVLHRTANNRLDVMSNTSSLALPVGARFHVYGE